MSDEKDGAEAQASGMPDTAGLAIDLAMEEARGNPALQGQVAAFLDDQRGLIADQRHHMREQFKQVRLATFSQRLSIALKLATGLIGIVIAAGVGTAVWNASQASGLVVDGFSVPSQLAASGTSGEVIAEDLNEKLALIRDTSDARSLTRSSLVSATRDNDIKVEVPETGVSMGEIWRVMRRWFGHERHLAGNVRALADGKLALTVSLNGANAAAFSGTSGELEQLEQQAAEHAFAQVDPVNFTIYLQTMKRYSEILPRAEQATKLTESPAEKANGISFWASMTLYMTGDAALSYQRARLSLTVYPRNMPGYRGMAAAAMQMGRDEEALQLMRVIPTLKEEDQARGIVGRGVERLGFQSALFEAATLGDFTRATAIPCDGCSPAYELARIEFAALGHDPGAAKRRIEALIIAAGSNAQQVLASGGAGLVGGGQIIRVRYAIHALEDSWQAAATDARDYAARLETGPDGRKFVGTAARTQAAPLLAVALAHQADFTGAHKALETTPTHCYPCLRARGQVSALEKKAETADRWFALAVAAAPSIPFAYHEWGLTLLARGSADAAIEEFKLANKKGPHFADPLEGWGEALMAKNQSHLALAKFREAEKYAPNWGRLHLKWGEALVYAGRKEEAKVQFSRAAQLDLTPSEKSELSRIH